MSNSTSLLLGVSVGADSILGEQVMRGVINLRQREWANSCHPEGAEVSG